MFLMGFIIMSTALLLPQLMQTQYGYTALQAGLVMSPGSFFTIFSMVLVGRTAAKVDPRIYLAIGLFCTVIGVYMMAGYSPNTTYLDFVGTRTMQMFWVPFLFIPMNMLAFAGLPREQLGAASALMALSRSIGGSLGLSGVVTYLARMRQAHDTYLGGHARWDATGYQTLRHQVAGLAPHFHGAMLDRMTADVAQHMVQGQAELLAYLDSFRLLAFLLLVPILGVGFVRVPKRATDAPSGH
jgi:DHA2 family multidrug resistance protein